MWVDTIKSALKLFIVSLWTLHKCLEMGGERDFSRGEPRNSVDEVV